MKHRFSRVLAGLLAMILVVSSGSGTVFAKANQKYAAAGVIGTEEPGKTGAPEGDAQNPEKDTTEGKEQTPDTTPEQPSGDTTPGRMKDRIRTKAARIRRIRTKISFRRTMAIRTIQLKIRIRQNR